MEAARLDIASGSVCDDVRALASLALDGALVDEVGKRLLGRHVGDCPACARFVSEMGATTALLRIAPLEPFRCAPFAAGRVGRTGAHRSHWATMAAAIVAVTIGVASLPQSSSPPAPVPGGVVRADAPVKLPIGQRTAESDFADSPPIELWA
jgi:hypothetical protein